MHRESGGERNAPFPPVETLRGAPGPPRYSRNPSYGFRTI